MKMVGRTVFACLLPLILSSCLLAPGKFVASLAIQADRNFAFTYKGELIASDPAESMSSAGSDPKADAAESTDEKARKAKEREEKNRAIATELAKEQGYRSVVYRGQGVFEVDYEIKGMLTTNFTYPFNSDAEVLLPFVAIEVRKDNTVRVRAPGFGAAPGQGTQALPLPFPNSPSDRTQGSFTLTTNADILAQNQEDGAKPVGQGKQIVWTIGKVKKDTPTAVLKMRN